MSDTAHHPVAPPSRPIRLAILISGSGRTMVNLFEQTQAGTLAAQIVQVISSRADVSGVDRARELGLPVEVVSRKQSGSAEAFGAAIWERIRAADPDLVVLAGFMCFLPIPSDWAGRVLNIHPALLPKFGGQGMYGHHVHEAVIAAGETESGCTVHFADNEYDHGPIILQRRCEVKSGDTADDLAARVFEQECLAYPQAIAQVQAQRLSSGSA